MTKLDPSQFLPSTWVDSRLEVRDSPISGKGIFLRADVGEILQGEILQIFGGNLFTREDVRAGKHRPYSLLAIDEGVYLGMPVDSAIDTIDQYTNHSCDPSAWLTDAVTLVARRDIQVGDEVTMDYARWEDDEEHVYFTGCKCGAVFCRGLVSGRDWRLTELQLRYAGHFSPFIQRRIEAGKQQA